MDDYKNILSMINGLDKFQRIAMNHPVPWYVGIDSAGRWSLFCITTTPPKTINDSKMLSVFIGIRRDGQYGITFSLTDNEYKEQFVHFCEDMISYTSDCSERSKVSDLVCGRYMQWQAAFKKNNGKLLSFEEIKGLVGELCFMRSFLFSKYGVEKSLMSWGGLEYNDQDFRCDATWYEIKATVSGASTVKISSVEQLDSVGEGHLVVMYLDKTSDGDSGKLTLNSLYEEILNITSSEVQKERFKSRMLSYGYYVDKAYDQVGFRLNGMDMYKVDESFPCLRKTEVPFSVQNVKYELSLPGIAVYKEN